MLETNLSPASGGIFLLRGEKLLLLADGLLTFTDRHRML
jgi:hypothetical protein